VHCKLVAQPACGDDRLVHVHAVFFSELADIVPEKILLLWPLFSNYNHGGFQPTAVQCSPLLATIDDWVCLVVMIGGVGASGVPRRWQARDADSYGTPAKIVI